MMHSTCLSGDVWISFSFQLLRETQPGGRTQTGLGTCRSRLFYGERLAPLCSSCHSWPPSPGGVGEVGAQVGEEGRHVEGNPILGGRTPRPVLSHNVISGFELVDNLSSLLFSSLFFFLPSLPLSLSPPLFHFPSFPSPPPLFPACSRPFLPTFPSFLIRGEKIIFIECMYLEGKECFLIKLMVPFRSDYCLSGHRTC